MKKLTFRVVKTTILLLCMNTAMSQVKTVALRETVTSSPAMVTHMGNIDNSVLLKVQYDNLSGEKFALTIKDQNDEVLYHEVYSDKKFSKKFQLPKENAEKLQFIIKGIKTNHTQTFEVNTNTRMVEEMVVKKIG
jgi:hypothetical protein